MSPSTAVVCDLVAVLVFVAIGRASHDEPFSPSGFAETAWPFLAGAALGWLFVFGYARLTATEFAPGAILPSGVVIWVTTVIAGMLLRSASDQGIAASFIVVASIATAVLLLGWRAVAAGLNRRR
ncbi:MAG: DUF3054 domain-containing protein [Gordonia sp. (in: high G+C Gram-positive bacteria)]